ncbi:hypothetical protein CCMA1212_004253 [Trichoderma ghanense]|uniref:Uncharacterized protein n=1 Tax=Trichoderma ghanense TaxID=65468 RepID=A0ABY2H6W0_9HYPO
MPRRRPRAPRPRGAHNLGPFEKPGDPYRMSHIIKWAKYGVGDSDRLWGSYWERFNTVQIPIFGETDYFNYALEIAKLAKGSEEEFERIYKQRNKERMGEFLELLVKADDRAFWKYEEFPCEDAADKICAVCRTGALEDFARLLKGIAFGWEADTVHDAQPDGHLSECEEGNQSSDSYAGSDYGYWTREREVSAEWKDPKFRAEMAACVEPLGVLFFQPSTGATFQPFAGATSKDDAEVTKSTPYATADEGPSVQKQPPLLPGGASAAEEDEEKQDDTVEKQTQRSHNVDDREHQRHNSETLTTPSTSASAFPIEGMTDQKATGAGFRPDSRVYECKLQQQQGATALSTASRGLSSTQKPQNGRVAMKRARPDDDSDQNHANNDSDDNHKRRKTERFATRKAEDKSEATGDKRGCRQRGKEKSSPPLVQPTASGVTNTRSRRRNGAFTLWELDSLGRPRAIS